MWLSRTMNVGRPFVSLKYSQACSMRSMSFASPTRSDVPAVAHEAGGDVLCEGDARVAFDRDVVVVVDPAEIVEPQMARERRRLAGDALHHAAVAADRVDVVVEDLEAGPVVAVGEPLLRRSPCRRWWRRPGRAGRSWSRRPRPSDTRGGPEPCCRAGGNAGCRRG